MLNEKRLIEIFKNFVEKALLPQIKKFDGSLQQWKKFASMLSQQAINYQQLSSYVDSLGGSSNNIMSLQKNSTPGFLRKQPQLQHANSDTVPSFNPSKTFGGQRARLAMLQKFQLQGQDKKFDVYRDNQGQRNQQMSNNQHGYALDRIYKNFSDYHTKIEELLTGLQDQQGIGGKRINNR